MKKSFWRITGLAVSLMLVFSLLSGCSSDKSDDQPTNQEQTITDDKPAVTDEPAVEEVSTEIVVTDQIGRVITLPNIPEKIVSLAPSNTEILFSLGLGDKIIGVTDYCDYPAAALEKPKVGGYSTADVEKIIAAEPDVIFVTNIHIAEVLPTLEDLGQTVIVLDPKTLDQVIESFTIIGKATGTGEKASAIVSDMSARIKAITDKTSKLSEDQKLRTFYVMWNEPLMTVGGDTRISEMIEKAGGINMFKDTDGYPTIDLETLVEANPQVIIAGSGMGTGADAPLNFALTEERLASSEARINGRVYGVNTDLTGRPTERMIEGFEEIAKLIHPELFN